MNYLDQLAEEIEYQLLPKHRPPDHAIELYRLYALLALVRGRQTTLENVHDAWSTWMCPQEPDHPSLVPFADLEADQQEQDRPYLEAILRACASLETHR